MKKFVKVLLLLVVIAAVIGIFGAVYTVKENQYAAVMQFGKIVRVDDTVACGDKITNDWVRKHLRGKKGTKVKVGVIRGHNP
ncbi:MAG: hypothetical protein ACSW75_05200, partial [Lachnospiraceae bacterium]